MVSRGLCRRSVAAVGSLRVRLSRDSVFVGQEPRLSARVCPAAFPGAVDKELQGPANIAPSWGNISVGLLFQYRISGDAVATSCRVKVAKRVPKRGRASLGLRMPVDLARERAPAKPSTVR
jgi:hypothetical protein